MVSITSGWRAVGPRNLGLEGEWRASLALEGGWLA
jgi:hypothetical protein